MGKNTSISLGSHFEEFVSDRINTGRYGNASEVIRAGLRLLENDENKFDALKQALIQGEESGIEINYDPNKHLKSLQNKFKEMNE